MNIYKQQAIELAKTLEYGRKDPSSDMTCYGKVEKVLAVDEVWGDKTKCEIPVIYILFREFKMYPACHGPVHLPPRDTVFLFNKNNTMSPVEYFNDGMWTIDNFIYFLMRKYHENKDSKDSGDK